MRKDRTAEPPLDAQASTSPQIAACHCCGQTQRLPALPRGRRLACSRCGTTFSDRRGARGRNVWAAAAAASSLVLYPLGIGLPVLEIERFGHSRASSIWHGTLELLAEGELAVGLTVFLCSIVLPIAKLLGLLALVLAPRWLGPDRLRARAWRSIEWLGRWGMLDVLLVAVLVATLKLGDIVEVHPGPGLLAFASMVGLSLIAGALFDPHALWTEAPPAPALAAPTPDFPAPR